jgi:hypothetical protein
MWRHALIASAASLKHQPASSQRRASLFGIWRGARADLLLIQLMLQPEGRAVDSKIYLSLVHTVMELKHGCAHMMLGNQRQPRPAHKTLFAQRSKW